MKMESMLFHNLQTILRSTMSEFKYIDKRNEYGRIMQFGKNKKVPIHRWYPFVEGYSKEFICSIVEEISRTCSRPEICMDPFSGSGSPSLELQELGIVCHAFEVNPFMYTLSRAKIFAPYYSVDVIVDYVSAMKDFITTVSMDQISLDSYFPTLVEGDGKKKWNIDKSVYLAIQKIKMAIACIEDENYRYLFTTALASILIDFSNLYRNGKCLSYKPDWRNRKYSETDVLNSYWDVIDSKFTPDLKTGQFRNEVDNSKNLHLGDARVLINISIPDDSIDLIITSPPYLNSRDYTDSYMLELKALDYVKTYQDITAIRKGTVRSHVQLRWVEQLESKSVELKSLIEKLDEAENNGHPRWNKQIINMIRAYFRDMEDLFKMFFQKVKSGGYIYFNVSNSAYYGILVDTIKIIADIAETSGFNVVEIREARDLLTSPQQRKTVGTILEAVIVMRKE